MKVSDFIFKFKPNDYSHDNGLCMVRIFLHENNQFSLLTDLDDKNGSSSVTNSVEYIRKQLINEGFIYNDTIIIEHYEEGLSGYGTFDIVTFNNNDSPHWEKTTLKKVQTMIGCSPEELLDSTLKNKRLFEKIESLNQQLYPYTQKSYVEDHNIITKRLKIKENYISKKDMIDLIKTNPTEREIAEFIKKDLSFFASFYANPKEEYIVLPELNIADGFVDYVILSGRSRMDVTFIEIKGANFNLLNQSGYSNLSQKTNEALQQVRERFSVIYRDYEKYRNYFHEVRENVENGTRFTHALLGPKGKLSVDPNKDINIRSVVIAGRSKNDLEESRQRHNVEITSSPPIRLESWDSLINKY
jgi:hypothetical protein